MGYIQLDERTWMVPMRRSALTGRFISQASETIDALLERLEGYYEKGVPR